MNDDLAHKSKTEMERREVNKRKKKAKGKRTGIRRESCVRIVDRKTRKTE